MTRQRCEILAFLRSRTDHPDAFTVHSAVRRCLPRLSLFTVYRSLHAFEEAGLLVRVATWKGHARYDACTHPHAHFLCTECGAIADAVHACEPLVNARAVRRHYGMIRRVQTMIYGVCASCMARGTDNSLRADTNKRRGDRRPSRAIREETSR